MKHKGFVILERASTDLPFTWRRATMEDWKKSSIDAYERTTGAYLSRTGNYKTDHKLKLAYLTTYEIEIKEPK